MLKAYPDLGITGSIKQHPDDFRVTEDLGFAPSGAGEHVMLWVEKTNANTEWVAKQLAKVANVPTRNISFAGVKDRHAVTQQWFSVWLKNKPEPDWLNIQHDEFKILNAERHNKKLKRGSLKGNYFEIIIRDVKHDYTESELEKVLHERCTLIQSQGVPNYFGEQRFGFDNIAKAEAWFKGDYQPKKQERAWLLSAARSFLFNKIIEARIKQNSWQTIFPDDRLILAGTQSYFINDGAEDLQKRFDDFDIHIAGILYGKTKSDKDMPTDLEQRLLSSNKVLTEGLVQQGVDMQRRSLRLVCQNLTISNDDATLKITFNLGKGCYATELMQEMITIDT